MSSFSFSRVAIAVVFIVSVVVSGCGAPATHTSGAAGTVGPASVAELQKIVDEAAVASGAAGVQVSVIRGDERADLVWGTANAELEIPMTVNTIIQIGSTTKVFNAAMVLTLVEEGTLDLDEPVKTYIPDFDISDDTAEGTMTLRQLLSMSSGLDNGPYDRHGGGDDALARYVAALDEIPQAYPPGEGFGYSNAGTSIAGHAAERITGQTWDALLRERIFEPAGLDNAVTRAQELPYQSVSAGHTQGADGQPPAIIRPWYITQAQGPAGSTLAMSACDLASFGEIFVRGGLAANGTRVLSESAVEIMTTPVVDVPSRGFTEHWCVGLEREHWGGTPVFGHAGGNMSGVSYLKVFPELDGVLAITCNTPSALGVFAEKIFNGFGAAVFGVQPTRLIAPEPPITINNADRYIGTYAMLGASYEVTRDGEVLKMRATAQGATTDYILVPLGDDAFLMKGPQNAGALSSDVAFFGDDGQGRATNLVAPVFPARRTE